MTRRTEPRAMLPHAMQEVLAHTSRAAAPTDADRARITDALRARLGVAALPEGFVPPAANPMGAAGGAAAAPRASAGGIETGDLSGLGDLGGLGSIGRAGRARGLSMREVGTRGWLGVVAGTGVMAGALGFLLGLTMAEHDDHGVDLAAPAAIERTPATEAPTELERPAPPPGAAEPPRPDRSGVERESGPAAPAAGTHRADTSSIADGQTHAALPRPRLESSRAGRLSFAEVLERLRRANLALRHGQASLALIHLSELDRRGGETLREEREVTRVLALCASGDSASARRAAAALLTRADGTIYAPRLESSCARDGEPPQP